MGGCVALRGSPFFGTGCFMLATHNKGDGMAETMEVTENVTEAAPVVAPRVTWREAKGPSLRDHVDAARIIREFIDEAEGEITPAIEELLLDNENATKEKVEAIAYFVQTEKDRAKGIQITIDRLTSRKNAIENRCEWLTKVYLFEQLKALGLRVGEAIKGTLATARLQYNNPRLDGEIAEDRLVDLKITPDAAPFVRYNPESYALDKVPLLTAMKAAQGLLDNYATAQDTVLDEHAKQKDRDKAQALIDSTTDEELAKAQKFLSLFVGLKIVRDESIRLA